jgi:hypothetical protein
MLARLFIQRLADLVIPFHVVPPVHLITEKSREQKDLRSADL